MDELDDPDLDGEPVLLDDVPIIVALLVGAIAILFILFSNWPTIPSKQEPINSEEDTDSSEADKPEDLLFSDSDDSDENEMEFDFLEDEEYYMVKIDHGLMHFKKIEDENEQERLHAVIEHEVTSSDEDENETELDLTPEEYMEKIDRGQMSLEKKSEENSIDKEEQEPYLAATEIQKTSNADPVKEGTVEEAEQGTYLVGSRGDFGPVDKRSSTLDQGSVQLGDSRVEINVADAPERKEVEKKISIEEGDAQGSLQAGREDADTTTFPTIESVERTVRKISPDESREDISMETDGFDEGHEVDENEVTSTEGTATGMSSDEREEDASTMEKDGFDEGHEVDENEVTSTEGTATGMSSDEREEDASTMEKDRFDEEHEVDENEVTSTEGTATGMSSDEREEDASTKEKDRFEEEHEVDENEVTSTEGTATGMSSDEREEDASTKEKDRFEEEHEVDENEVTSTEGTATGMSSDEREEDASIMEKDRFDEEHEVDENEVTSTEGKVKEVSSDETGSTEDVILKANDDLDVDHGDTGAKPEYIRESTSVMERGASRFSFSDGDSTTSDNGEVMNSASSRPDQRNQ